MLGHSSSFDSQVDYFVGEIELSFFFVIFSIFGIEWFYSAVRFLLGIRFTPIYSSTFFLFIVTYTFSSLFSS